MYQSSFSERDMTRFGTNILSNFFDLYLIDCSGFVKKNENVFEAQFLSQSSNNLIFKNYKTIKKFLDKINLTFYIDLLGSDIQSFKTRRLLKNKSVLRIKLSLGMLPWVKDNIGIITRLNNLRKAGNFIDKLFNQIFTRLLSKFEPSIDIQISSGSACQKSTSPHVNNIWTHSFDYQEFIEKKSCSDSNYKDIGEYALFIDQYAPSHPDYSFHGNNPPVSEDKYYKSLNKFFDYFEEKVGFNIVIAGHPKRNEKSNYCWNNRKQIIGNTSQLISQSSIVLTHYSTAISFAVLNRKPILLITTDEYINSYRRQQFYGFSEALNLDILNVDQYNEFEVTHEIFRVNEKVYSDYEEKYIRSKLSKSNDIWKHVSEYLINIKSS